MSTAAGYHYDIASILASLGRNYARAGRFDDAFLFLGIGPRGVRGRGCSRRRGEDRRVARRGAPASPVTRRRRSRSPTPHYGTAKAEGGISPEVPLLERRARGGALVARRYRRRGPRSHASVDAARSRGAAYELAFALDVLVRMPDCDAHFAGRRRASRRTRCPPRAARGRAGHVLATAPSPVARRVRISNVACQFGGRWVTKRRLTHGDGLAIPVCVQFGTTITFPKSGGSGRRSACRRSTCCVVLRGRQGRVAEREPQGDRLARVVVTGKVVDLRLWVPTVPGAEGRAGLQGQRHVGTGPRRRQQQRRRIVAAGGDRPAGQDRPAGAGAGRSVDVRGGRRVSRPASSLPSW